MLSHHYLVYVVIGSDFGLDFFQIRFEIGDLDWISNPIFAKGFGLDFKSKCSGFLKGLFKPEEIANLAIFLQMALFYAPKRHFHVRPWEGISMSVSS